MTEAKVTGKGGSTKVQDARLDVSKLDSDGARLVPTCGSVFMLGNGVGRWHLLAPFFLKKPISDTCLSETHSEISK